MRLERSLNGLESFSLMRCSIPRANPTSHSPVEKAWPLVYNFWRSLCSQALGMDDLPKLKRAWIDYLGLCSPEVMVSVSVGYTLAIIVSTEMEISLHVSLWTRITAEEQWGLWMFQLEDCPPQGSLPHISFLKGLSVSILQMAHTSLDGTTQSPGPIHQTFHSGLSRRVSVSCFWGRCSAGCLSWITCVALDRLVPWLRALRCLKKLAFGLWQLLFLLLLPDRLSSLLPLPSLLICELKSLQVTISI